MPPRMSFPLHLNLPYALERDPPGFEDNAIKYPESLARHFIKTYTKRGDRVFDPFAGLGTTLFVAEELGRVPFGIEYDAHRHEWVAGQLNHWTNMVCGDAGAVEKFGLPKMDFCMASPPFMRITDKWNPLYAGNPKQAGYDRYLKRMGVIYARLANVMKRGAVVVVHADNLAGKTYTPLVRDLSLVIGKSMRLEAETIVTWTGRAVPDDYHHTHCLVFRNAKP